MSWMLSSILFGAVPARAEAPRYALVVGSNRPGAEQAPLLYAQEDAQRVVDVLTEIGGFEPDAVEVLLDPDAQALDLAIDRLRDRVTADSLVLFYYSGHARAQALELGSAQVPLAALRKDLDAIPAKVRLVVLDACQTGAFSQVKGAAPAQDFSWHSVNELSAEGLAVLASSTSTELSQESPEIEGSYFTHHLVSGLRGAADLDGDGAVTLAEAYAYAHDRTLVATAKTAVGEQHVTLETELKGRGELVLTRPASATARLVFEPALAADLLLHRDEAVVAEVTKSRGAALTLALAPGTYEGILREDGRAFACTVSLQDGEARIFDPDSCAEITVAETTTKESRPPWRFLEGATGLQSSRSDGYTDRLREFGFTEALAFISPRALSWSASAFVRVTPNFGGGLQVGTLDEADWRRDRLAEVDATETASDAFRYQVHRLGPFARAELPLFSGHFVPYLQSGFGPTYGTSTWTDPQGELREHHWGYYVLGAVGGQLMITRGFGGFLQVDESYAPTTRNLVGDVHDAGGIAITLGLRAGL